MAAVAIAPRPRRTTGSVREQRGLLSKLSERFALTEDRTLAELVHYRPGRAQRFHRWFRYREGYSPELVSRAMGALARKPQLVLDPFCGSGSSMLAAQGAGVPSVGLDINPVAVLVARAKTRQYTPRQVARVREQMRALAGIRHGQHEAERPAIRILDQLFKPDILDALLVARAVIDVERDEAVRDLLRVGWLSVLEEVSNVFKEGNGIKYRNRRRTPNGYVTIPWNETEAYRFDGFELVRAKLAEQYAAMLDDLAVDQPAARAEVHEASALHLSEYVDAETVDLCIFSPPYCNNFNYMKIFKVELWMGGFVRSYADFREINARALRSHVETKLLLPPDLKLPLEVLAVAEWIRGRELWNLKIPASVLAYFVDMRASLAQIFRALRRGGECHIVVGNSAYAGVLVPTDLFLAQIARDLGFDVDRVVQTRHLTTSSQQRLQLEQLLDGLRESVVVLRRP